MFVLKNIKELAVCPNTPEQADIGIIPDGAVAWTGDRIAWVGPENKLPEQYAKWKTLDARGGTVVPGLIDCHTHLAFGGWRPNEFRQRVLGADYIDIAKSGGGILSTVRSTRETSEAELLKRCTETLEAMSALGVTTVECKSGYGLSAKDELKILSVYQTLKERAAQTIVATFLGAHTVPPEFSSNRKGYIDLLIQELIPKIADDELAEFCDVFVEEAAFSRDEARKILLAAKDNGLGLKLHVDQFSDSGGAELAAELGADSADHLEYVSEQGIEALAAAGTVGVMLPFAALFTFEPPLNARGLIEAGIPVAVATDFNPGTAPTYHLPLAMMLSCTMNRLTPHEALKGATIYAARALTREREIGSLEPSKLADLCVIDSPSVEHWLYHFRGNACRMTVKAGEVVFKG